METFRSKFSWLLLVAFSLACTPSQGSAAAAGATPARVNGVEVATIQKTLIEHVTPRRDYVGKRPPRFEGR